jgi:hypothetical protein
VVVKDRDTVELTDLPCFGQSAILAWRKIRWECPGGCGSFTEQAPQIAAPRLKVTDRAARWATVQVGRHGRSEREVAKGLGCGWHAVMDAVAAYGQLLIDDPDRFGDVTALGLEETLRVPSRSVAAAAVDHPDRRRRRRSAPRHRRGTLRGRPHRLAR